MRRLLIVLAILLIIVVIAIVALLNLGRIIDARKEFFITRAERVTGRQVDVGKIGVSLRGGIGISVRDVVVSDDPDFSMDNFIEADELRVRVALFPLLRKELQVKRVILEKPKINVIRNNDGRFNFDTIGRSQRSEAAGPDEDSTAASGRTQFALMVAFADISKGKLRFEDQAAASVIHVENIDFSIEGVQEDRPASIELKASVFSGDDDTERANVKIKGQAGPIGDPLGALNIPVNFDFALGPIDLASVAQMNQISGKLPPDLALEGPMKAEGHVEGSLASLMFAGKADLTDCAIRVGDRFRKPTGVPCWMESKARMLDRDVEIEQADLMLNNMSISGKGGVKLGARPNVNLSFRSDEADLAGWDEMLPALGRYLVAGKVAVDLELNGAIKPGALPPARGFATMKGASIKTPQMAGPVSGIEGRFVFSTGDKQVLVDSLHVAGMGGTVKGNGRIDLRNETPRLSFDAKARNMDLAGWRGLIPNLEKYDPAGKINAEINVSGDFKPGVIPDARGLVTMKEASIRVPRARNPIKDVAGNMVFSMKGKQVLVDSLNLDGLGGTIRGHGNIDLRKTPPQFSFDTKARGLNLVNLVSSTLARSSSRFQGNVNLDIHLGGQGKKWADVRSTLDGAGVLAVLQGAILDMNIAKELLNAIAGELGSAPIVSEHLRKTYPHVFTATKTEFREFEGDVLIKGGRIHAPSFHLGTEDYSILGKGSLGLDWTVDSQAAFILSPRLSKSLIEEAGFVSFLTDDQGRVQIPFSMTGRLQKVAFKPDISGKIQESIISPEIDKLKKKLFDQFLPSKKRKKEN
ncbi:MAG: AsmA family protein [Candidatus Latescibacteria bacterium]|nr:AsmA family protein [Candidatus Latescibacterota bacterium]NIM66506.1 AsmA family protein [Candidatus Latescibacterota bacterium]NIO02986.1 AsmA family protein [Candidatus Latescibacterota bacterium]NIO30121.1 AsmA family protein [Candidatus Latescibacterota bacterium]NIO57740.1 AsmA family protein [Candidatus Latescibacterota bacterium]